MATPLATAVGDRTGGGVPGNSEEAGVCTDGVESIRLVGVGDVEAVEKRVWERGVGCLHGAVDCAETRGLITVAEPQSRCALYCAFRAAAGVARGAVGPLVAYIVGPLFLPTVARRFEALAGA